MARGFSSIWTFLTSDRLSWLRLAAVLIGVHVVSNWLQWPLEARLASPFLPLVLAIGGVWWLLSQERASRLEPETREFARQMLAPLVARGGGDICTEFSSFLPVRVFGLWMRMPAQWLDTLHDDGRAFVLAVHRNEPELMKETSLRLYDMARDLVRLRREEPEDPAIDPTSALLAAVHQGKPLPED